MNVKQAIEQLLKLPQDAELVVPDLGVGGCVPVISFEFQVGEVAWVVVVGDVE